MLPMWWCMVNEEGWRGSEVLMIWSFNPFAECSPLEQESLPEVAEEVVLFEIFTEEELVVLEVTKSCRHNGSEFNAYIGQ